MSSDDHPDVWITGRRERRSGHRDIQVTSATGRVVWVTLRPGERFDDELVLGYARMRFAQLRRLEAAAQAQRTAHLRDR